MGDFSARPRGRVEPPVAHARLDARDPDAEVGHLEDHVHALARVAAALRRIGLVALRADRVVEVVERVAQRRDVPFDELLHERHLCGYQRLGQSGLKWVRETRSCKSCAFAPNVALDPWGHIQLSSGERSTEICVVFAIASSKLPFNKFPATPVELPPSCLRALLSLRTATRLRDWLGP